MPLYEADDDAVARVLASHASEVARRAPTGPGPWQDLKVTGYLCVPLTDRGRTFATLTLLTTGDRVIDGHTVALAEELARRAASAARNARQYAQRVTLARDLQAGLLLTEPPTVPGVELATSYHPAGEGLDIGGDFYDVFPLDDGRWAFLLGDVSGRGALAATTTALVRHTARTAAALLPDPETVLQAVNRALLQRPGSGFVTLVYGHFTTAHGGIDIEYVRAGHPQPVHLAPAGARFVSSQGHLLGIMDHPRLATHRMHLAEGDSLVLYTDGITEARGADGDLFGDARLLDTFTSCPPRAQAVLELLARGLGDFTAGSEKADDEAILILTAAAPPRSPAEPS
ncbi:PP2C family protein-serine/threonine phosphatase [Streptomyces sp. NPDC048507]|uniref:PP2C family protein-serine/threonine phosphatase n=1 Tax=Streptomyces sp. NPDC048507 TaxID=3365560 RepID=UPI00372392F3